MNFKIFILRANIVEVDRYEVLQENFFSYIYTGEIDQVENLVSELLTDSDKYYIKRTVLRNNDRMFKKVSTIEYLTLATTNNAENLKLKICISYAF